MTNKNDLIFSFKDTLNIASSEMLKTATETAIYSSRVYKEGFISNAEKCCYKEANIEVISNTSFAAAKDFCSLGKVAVLNFANPENPGGGVQDGAMAQEECLCRSSNLYPCLCNNTIFADFYLYHRNLHNYFYTDRLIYTKDVTVFKDDSDIPKLMPENEWFKVDVITCAAPYLVRCQNINEAHLEEIFKTRIKNIFEAALDNGAQVLILGAFGCGAFKNPPEVVARAFNKVIFENDYKTEFKKIVFAIKSKVNDDPYMICPNLTAFKKEFCETSNIPFEKAVEQNNITDDIVMKNAGIPNFYLKWKIHNPYFSKQFSILGDSISTLDGYNPHGYNVFYSGENCIRSGVKNMKNTWWGKVIEYFGGELLVNNSWSGSRVTKLPGNNSLFPSGCSDERTGSLHIRNVIPDVIIVYLGTNDWAQGVSESCANVHLSENSKFQSFDFAYSTMISKIKSNYPEAEIWCCTLNTTYISINQSFKFPLEFGGKHIEIYNSIIRKAAQGQACRLIDLYSYSLPYDSIDGSHPNVDGMNTLAQMVICSVIGKDPECSFNNGTLIEDLVNKSTDNHCYTYSANVYDNTKQFGQNLLIAGKYQVIRHIRKGNVFDFYLVKDKKLNAVWDAKIYFKNKMLGSNDDSLNLVYQVIRDQKTLRHRSIPQIVDVIDCNDYICVIQDHISGNTFESIVDNYGPQPVENVVDWVKQICDLINYIGFANSLNIYSDIEPVAVLIRPNGTLAITEISNMQTLRFTPNQGYEKFSVIDYSLIEQQGEALEHCRTDIYGLGMTMAFLLIGRDFKKVIYNHKDFSSNKYLTGKIKYIINKCINYKAIDKYRSVSELLYDLNNMDELPN